MLPQDGVFFSGVRDADAVIGIGEWVVEEGVGDNGAGIGEPEQRVIGEHCAKAQQTSDEQSLKGNKTKHILDYWNLGSRVFKDFYGLLKSLKGMIAEHCREHWMAFTVWITFNRKYMIPIMTCNFQFTSWASVDNAEWQFTIRIDSLTKKYRNLTMTS